MPLGEILSIPRAYDRKGAPSVGVYLIAPKSFQLPLLMAQLSKAYAALNASEYEKNMHALELSFPKKIHDKQREQATQLVKQCHHNGIVAIIRDDVGLCIEVAADGVMLSDVNDFAQARTILGEDGIIGVDCKNEKETAQAALDAGADYVSFSRFYSASQKQCAEVSLLEWWSTTTHLPAVAVSNLNAARGVQLVQSGAGFLGAGNWVWNHKEGSKAAIHWLQQMIEQGLTKQIVH